MGIKESQLNKYIGPWPDGLISRHEGSYDVAESFLYDCINFDVSDYGVLVQRPGFVRFHDAWTDGWPANFNNNGAFRILGSHPTASATGNLRLYVSIVILVAGTWRERIFFTDDPTTGSPTQIIENNHGAGKPADNTLWSQSILYKNKIYFIRRNIAAAGAFPNNVKMDNPDNTGATAVSIAAGNGKYGYYAFVMQDRLFVVDMNGYSTNYSKATDFETWTAPDGGAFDVSPGDSQQTTAVIALEDVVYFFREDSTWAFTFNTDPAVDGILRLISRNTGAFDATTKGNEIYIVNRQGVFRFLDGQFIDIAQNIRSIMEAGDSWGSNISITVVGNRLIVGGLFTSGSFSHLSMNLTTGAWSKYQPTDQVISANSKRSYPVSKQAGKSFMVWGDTFSGTASLGGITDGGYFTMMRIGTNISDPDDKCRDQDRFGVVYAPSYTVVTVPLALDDSSKWKRLYRWRFDIKQVDPDNTDIKPTLSVREGDPDVVDASAVLPNYPDFYVDFFDSVMTKSQRFKVMQFGLTKAATVTDPQAGNNIAETQTMRIRGLEMTYAVKGPIRQ